MTVRTAAAFDFPTLLFLEEQIFSGSEKWSSENIRETMQSGNTLTILAEEDGNAAGFIMVSVVLETAELLNVGVLPEYRRKGIAQRLYDAAEKAIREKEAVHMFLEVRENNDPAISFYRKNGFSEIALRKDYYHDPSENALVMEKKF